MSSLKALIRLLLLAVACLAGGVANARDAAFLSPGASMGKNDEAVKIDPKPDIDVGETSVNVAKRASIFFVNQTNMPVKIEKVTISSDSLVTAEQTANDCTKQGSIAPLSRCSVEVSVTPTGSGSWSVDVLMTHDGAGRLTRARLLGKTSGSGSEGKSTGLAISTKEIKPIDFGVVEVNGGKNVRSTLMINDSAEPISLLSIDVIEASNGLQRLKQGCAPDMELAPGASCPVTLLWEPQQGIPVSTDLIIRHSGKLGFVVIPVRGVARGGSENAIAGGGGSASQQRNRVVPLPPTAQQLEQEVAGRLNAVSEKALEQKGYQPPAAQSESREVSRVAADEKICLIGTIGDKAILLMPDGLSKVIATGGTFSLPSGTGKVISVGLHSADVMIGQKRITLPLEAASSLISAAMQNASSVSPSQGSLKK